MDIGFAYAGFDIIWANDFNKDACDTMRNWMHGFSKPSSKICKTEVVCGDITKINSADIPDADIMLGGFPCQGFSLSGPRKLDDTRNMLYREYVRILKAKQPLAFVGENVKGLLSMGNGNVMQAIIVAFSDCGYDVQYKLLNAKDYGVPQDRERVIIVGIRKDLNKQFEFPATAGFFVSMREAFDAYPVTPTENDVCREPYSSRYMSRNRKRGWDDVSFTIPAMAKQVPLYPGSPDMVKVGKDAWKFGEGETRRLSWQEASLIQSFPPDMQFVGNLTSKYRQIGNAVPPLLAYQIAQKLKVLLDS